MLPASVIGAVLSVTNQDMDSILRDKIATDFDREDLLELVHKLINVIETSNSTQSSVKNTYTMIDIIRAIYASEYFLKTGKHIQGIKAIRETIGSGLLDSKQLADALKAFHSNQPIFVPVSANGADGIYAPGTK